MTGLKRLKLVVVTLLAVFFLCAWRFAFADKRATKDERVVQARIVLTVSEGKRLIARAVAQMPIIRQAMKNGTVIVARGTTNTYVAEELLGRNIPHGAYVAGRVYPEKGGKRLADVNSIKDVVLVNGQWRKDLSLAQAVRMLKPGDVVIKGANALDYDNKLAAVIVGSSDAGTTGEILPYVGARKAHLVIPVGLEKQVAGDVIDIVRKMQEPVDSLNRIPTMFLLTGQIVTELEAIEQLAGVSAFQAAAGGIGGAEGAVWLICRGPRDKLEAALKLAEQIQGEPAFVQ